MLPCFSLTCLAKGGTGQSWSLRWDTHPYPGSYARGGQTGVKCGFEDHEFCIYIYFCLWNSEFSLFPCSSSGRYRRGHRVPSLLPRALRTSLAPRAHAVVAFSDFWILQADKHQNLGVYITKQEWGSCLSDSSSPQTPICGVGRGGEAVWWLLLPHWRAGTSIPKELE